ncbi:TonB-dependent receptor [Aquimarina brevivitae]|uniref:Iron complex outermembrane receptor protein n=1 Tax=Aquimarina brevivitae TaxID=323412 RepID=A0A4Q7PGA2_9FLAO|nr:TonB-dependent receptor [Aquimarina brevivitae]RZS99526.1 iron complex outermembrane receptor protein [Aquimarina brevivitae]
MKNAALIIVVLFQSIICYGQDCSKEFTGKILDFHDGVPLNNATITFNNTTIKSDKQGNFKITGLCPISYAFTISHPDCNSQVVTVDISEVTNKVIYLEHHYSDLEEVTLETTNEIRDTNSQTEDQLSKSDLEKYSSLTLGDALKEISGVTSLSSGNTIVKPVIQGLHSSRIIIMNNGVRQEDQEWGEEHAPNLDINAFNKIRVIKGSGALQYGGNAIGGVVVAENKLTSLKDTVFGRTQIAASSNGRGGGASASINLGFNKGWSSKFQTSIKRFGDSEAPDYILSNTGVSEQNFSAGLGYTGFTGGLELYYSFFNATQGILRASHLGNRGDYARAVNSPVPLIINPFTYDINAPKQETQHHLAKIKGYKRFKNLGKLTAQYSFQYNNRKEFDIRRGDDRDKPSLDLDLFTNALESSFLFDANARFKKTVGFQLTFQENIPDPETGIKRLIPDYKRVQAGLFAIATYDLKDNITLDAGIRYDFVNIDAKKFYDKDFWEDRGYDTEFNDLIIADEGDQWLTNPVLDFHSFAISGGLNFSYKDQDKFLINLSLANRAPNPVELFSDGLHHSAAIIEIGDLRTKQENALKLSLSNESHKLLGNDYITISPYVNFINNYIFLEPSGSVELTTRGDFPRWEYRQTDAILWGVDINYGVDLTENVGFNTGFSYIYGQDIENNEPIINMPAPSFRSELIFDQELWNLKLVNTTVLQQNRFPDNNFTDDFIEDGAIQTVFVDVSTPPKGYTLFDLAGTYKFSLWNTEDLSLGLTITNIFNTSYRDYLNRQRFFADNIGRNFTLNFNFKF